MAPLSVCFLLYPLLCQAIANVEGTGNMEGPTNASVEGTGNMEGPTNASVEGTGNMEGPTNANVEGAGNMEGPTSFQKRIIHGTLAPEGELLYQVSLQLKPGREELRSSAAGGYCGAALISDNMVATATHCTNYGYRSKDIEAVIGTTDLGDGDSPVFQVDKIIPGNYNASSKQNDISLLRIVRTGKENSLHMVKPVPVCSESYDPEGRMCVVSGYGDVKWHKQDGGGRLRKAQLKVLHHQTCTKMLRGHHWDPDNNSMICAGSLDKDACQGDSGGPLVCPTRDGGRCLAGLVSWGVGCATPGFPGVYTNVRNYRKWINEVVECNKTGEQKCNPAFEAMGKEKAREAVKRGKM